MGGRRIPKRIGGVKVPKKLRRRAEALLGWADRPIVSDTIAAALIAGAGAIADGKSHRDAGKAASLAAGAAAVKAANGADRIGLALGIAASELAAGLTGLLGDEDRPKASRGKRRKRARA
ncbi:MAG TPA: hypothetical protein VGD19_11405 [Allosphingosinicella sp.]|jgi:hypothetical protein